MMCFFREPCFIPFLVGFATFLFKRFAHLELGPLASVGRQSFGFVQVILCW